MNKKLTQIALALLATSSIATAQSNGESFDAAVVLPPGITLERNDNLYGNDSSTHILQDGDILRVKGDGTSEPYYILTTDGSVIAMAAGTTMNIEGSATGFGVFQTKLGDAWIAGNVFRGYLLPNWFRTRLPYNFGNVNVIDDGYKYPSYNPLASIPFYTNGYYGPYTYGYPNNATVFGDIYTLPWNSAFTIPGIR